MVLEKPRFLKIGIKDFIKESMLRETEVQNQIFASSHVYYPAVPFKEIEKNANRIISDGVKMGEGWLIPSEMLSLAEHGVNNIVCCQPFGCLPNHIVGKGMMHPLMPTSRYKETEIPFAPGDTLLAYTDGVTEATNAENKLFGDERLLNALNATTSDKPSELIANVMKKYYWILVLSAALAAVNVPFSKYLLPKVPVLLIAALTYMTLITSFL